MYTPVAPDKSQSTIYRASWPCVGRIDKVAYVRFASVYRSFEDVDEFQQLIRDI